MNYDFSSRKLNKVDKRGLDLSIILQRSLRSCLGMLTGFNNEAKEVIKSIIHSQNADLV